MDYDNVLDAPAGNLYPGYGATLGDFAAATSMFGRGGDSAPEPTPGGVADGPTDEISKAAAVGAQGNPIVALLAFAAMLVLLMWGAHKVGSDEDFKNIRMSFFNVFVIGWAAILGIWGWKIVFTRIKVPGFSTIVLGV